MRYEANFCPQCATPLVDREVFGRVRRVCPACGVILFRDPKVAVGGLVLHQDHALLVRRAVHPEKGKWALPAGYMEYDEEPIPALKREIREETGLQVRVLRLLDVFPLHNPFARGVIIVYQAEPEPPVPDTLQGEDDIDLARWFLPSEVPWDMLAFESTRIILRRWTEGAL